MKANIIINEKANQDLLQIKWYIEKDSKFYANKTVDEINNAFLIIFIFMS